MSLKQPLLLVAGLTTLLAVATTGATPTENLVISEFMALNNTTLPDEDGVYSDWIEIYNAGNAAVNLGGWCLTDSAGNLAKWRFPATNLPPFSFLVVFASGNNRTNAGAPLHTNFKLDGGGEYLALVKPDGVTVVSQYAPGYPSQRNDVSYGLGMVPGLASFLVPTGAVARYLVPTADIGASWTGVGFNDTAWSSGATGLGYDVGTNYASAIVTDIGAQLTNVNSSVYLRLPFSVADPSQLQDLKLRMRYDDGFIAYLNGTEVVRANAPVNATWNSQALVSHGSDPGVAARLRADFDTITNAYTPSQQGVAPGPAITAAGAGSTGKFLRLLNDAVNSQANSIAFNQTAPGLYPVITANFDFRISDTAGNPADGFAFMLIPTSTYGTSGVGVNPVGAVEEPNFAGVFSIGFDLYPHATQNDISAHWNGAEIVNVTIPRATVELVSGTFHHLTATLVYIQGGAQLTVVVTPNINGTPGTPYTVMDNAFIANLPQYDCRVQIAGRTGGADMSVDFDNIDVQFGYPGGMVPIEEFNLSSAINLLTAGNNVLAIHGLNLSSTNFDFLIEPQLVGRAITLQTNKIFLTTATPGAVNSGGAAEALPPAQFSLPGGVYASSQTVALSSPVAGAVIHYEINGGVPTEASPVYSAPISVTNSIALRTRVFAAGYFPSEVKTEEYTLLNPNVAAFSSPLPLVIVDGFNQTISADMPDPKAICNVTVIDVDAATGRSSFSGRLNFHGRAGVEGRGQTSWGFNKRPMNIELRDENDQDRKASLLDMPAGSDWALISLWNDKTFLNDYFGYELHHRMGHYAPRRRFVEVFWNGPYPGAVQGAAPTGDTVGTNDYVGIYLLIEKIRIDNNRVDIAQLDPADTTEPDISGGYIWKKDKDSPGDVNFTTPSGQVLKFHDPATPTDAQRRWLSNYIAQFEATLYGSNWKDPVNGYARYIDIDSFVDQHWIVEFTKQIDGYRLSNYMHKDREGKITMDPVWDWNLSFGNANYLRGGIMGGWYWTNSAEGITQLEHIWLRRLITGTSDPFGTSGDPDFRQKITDRWGELRVGVLGLTNVLALVDTCTNLLNEPKDRDFARFPRLGTYLWPNPNGATGGWDVDFQTPATFSGIIEQMQKWITGRFNWIETQFVKPPLLSRYGGSVDLPLNMLAPAGTVYYTVDGSDPRLPGGAISPNAVAYSGSVSLPPNARVVARAYLPGTNYMTPFTPWSPPAKAVFGYSTPSLAITELMYHPAAPPPGTATNAADDFEFIEFMNTTGAAIDLTGMRLADGVDFTFPAGPLAQAGAVTTNGFDGGGTPYASQTLGSGAGSSIQSGGPAGSYLRLLAQDTGTNRNRVAFDQTASGDYDRLVADFDFLAANSSTAPAGDVPTANDFDSPGSTYWLRNFDAADATSPALMTDGSGPAGSYIRMTRQINNESGGLYFDATEAATNRVIVVNFDFRCQGGADGFGFAFLPTATYGATGTNNVPAFSEEPNIAGTLGVGFDIYNNANPPTDYNANHVSLHWNNAMVSAPPANPTLSLAAGVFHRAQITIKFETSPSTRALVTMKISPDIYGAGGPTETLFNNFVVNGAAAYRGRVAFCARTGGANANQDIDNVNVLYLSADLPSPGGLSMQLLPASTFGTTGPGSALATFPDAPAASDLFGLDLTFDATTGGDDASLYWNGVQFMQPRKLNLDAGVFHRAHLELTGSADGALATLVIRPDVYGTGGAPVTLFSNALLHGFSPANARVEFAGRSGGQNLAAGLDNVSVRFERHSPNLLAAGARILVVKNRAAFESRYGTGLPIAGEYLGNLDNAGEHLLLLGRYGEPILDFSYGDGWYPTTDGAGFSLVVPNPSLPSDAWGNSINWRASANVGGSPGVVDPAPPGFAPVVISEALAHSDPVSAPGSQDYIELHNPSTTAADVGNWYLTDNFDRPKKYRIPAGTLIPAGGYAVIYESSFNAVTQGTNAFALRAEGDDVYVFSGDAAGNLTGWYHGFSFGASETNVSFGRVLKSTAEEDFVAQTARTPGNANSGPIIGPVVITEVMYHPPDYAGGVDNQDHEFVELRNISGAPVALYDAGHPENTWRLRDAVDFDFPTNTVLSAGAYALVVSFDPVADATRRAAFIARYGLTGSELLFGPYSGKLDNSADSVELAKPTPPDPNTGNVDGILVDKVRYHGEPTWPLAADGMGYSLHRLPQNAYGNDVTNWVAGPPTPAAGYTPGVAPVITQQPIGRTNSLGAPVTLSVTATGPGALRYQWRFNGANLPDATNSTHLIPAVTFDDSGEYLVVVLNDSGAVESAPATVLCNSIFTILVQPAGVYLVGSSNLADFGNTTNGAADFTVGALGNGVLSYQWRFNGNPILGANDTSLTVSNVNLTHQGSYDVVVSDALGSVTSQSAFLGVLIRPVIVVKPLSPNVVPMGGTLSAAVSIRGSPPPFGYLWRRSSTPIVANVTGSTNDVLAFGPATSVDGTTWRVIITNAAVPTVTGSSPNATFSVVVQPDFDQDGLPDPWEVTNGYSTNDASNASLDLDGDGHTLWQEYIAGTDPTNALSVLKVDRIVSGGGAGLDFYALSNRTYSLQFKDDLSVPAWSNLIQLITVTTNSPVHLTDPAVTNGSQRVYRIAVPAQP